MPQAVSRQILIDIASKAIWELESRTADDEPISSACSFVEAIEYDKGQSRPMLTERVYRFAEVVIDRLIMEKFIKID